MEKSNKSHQIRVRKKTYQDISSLITRYGESGAYHIDKAISEYKERKEKTRSRVLEKTRSKDIKKSPVSK